jgi:hypothetical protein
MNVECGYWEPRLQYTFSGNICFKFSVLVLCSAPGKHVFICDTKTLIPSENVTLYDLTSFTWNPFSNNFFLTLNVFLAFLSSCKNKARELKESIQT